jgi:hypothetical protein
MTIGAELPCPKCGRLLDPTLAWHDARSGACRECRVHFDFVGFPALHARSQGAVPKAVVLAEHATCYHHSENQAEAVCDGCGRFLCSVCAIPFAGRLLCPGCVKAATRTDVNSIGSRVLYEGIALGLAVLPLLVWPVTLIAAPVALGTVIYGWKKPRSLVEGGNTKLVVAGLIALAEIGAWAFLFVTLWLKRRR